jgi:hypothetical protein
VPGILSSAFFQRASGQLPWFALVLLKTESGCSL